MTFCLRFKRMQIENGYWGHEFLIIIGQQGFKVLRFYKMLTAVLEASSVEM